MVWNTCLTDPNKLSFKVKMELDILEELLMDDNSPESIKFQNLPTCPRDVWFTSFIDLSFKLELITSEEKEKIKNSLTYAW